MKKLPGKKPGKAKEPELHRVDGWTVAETAYAPDLNDYYETIFCLANGFMGQRGTPEEGFSGKNSMSGCFIAGVYAHFDAPHEWNRTGFAVKCDRMVQVLDWIGLSFTIGGRAFDPCSGRVTDYERNLDLRRGVLSRRLTFTDADRRSTRFEFIRFLSQKRQSVGAIRCIVTPLNHKAKIKVSADLRGRTGTDAVWSDCETRKSGKYGALLSEKVAGSGIRVAAAARLIIDGTVSGTPFAKSNVAGIEAMLAPGRSCVIDKIASICSSRDSGAKTSPEKRAEANAGSAASAGFEKLLAEHVAAWEKIWHERDVVIEGDIAAQQGIRFSIFQMEQCYSGNDDTLNIGARALSGPDHNGHYFWDTEAYMVPYYIWQAPEKARALLVQRHRTLPQAMARAELHGYRGAMYPWSTIDGTESALPWEYAQLQVHVSAAVPFAVWHYFTATGDLGFLSGYGAELMVQTCRFWADRSFFAKDGSCRINCVTGPDEYTIAIDNDHYTNAIVRFVFRKAVELLKLLRRKNPVAYRSITARLKLKDAETADWIRRAKAMSLPYERNSGIFPQHETFMDMEPCELRNFPEKWRPAWGRCPWERIIRLQIIKQPDVLLAMHLLAEEYTPEQMRANFDFYDPKTIHESSLGACIHAIVAGAIGRDKEAFGFYLRGARLDLDQRWTRGIRIANAAGAWQVIVNGFAGMRMSTADGTLSFNPRLPGNWKALEFSLHFQGRLIRVRIDSRSISLENEGAPLKLQVNRTPLLLSGKATVQLKG